jgi:hypothetical protein
MFSLLRRACPVALVLSVLVLPSEAAPTPKTGGTLNIEKYLLDDADGVLVINLKQILASPAYTKGVKKQLEDVLARPEPQAYLKDIGFDPLKDIDRVVVCTGKSCWRSEAGGGKGGPREEEGPYFLFQGKFDAAKMKAKMAALAKEVMPKVAISDEGGHKIYRIDPRGNGPFAAQVDATTVVLAGKRAHVVEALAKAAGKKKTKFASKEVPVLLKKLKPDVAIQGFALETFVTGGRATSTDDGMGKRTFKYEQTTLGGDGFKDAVLTIAVKDTLSGSVVLTVKDKARFKKLSDELNQGLDRARKSVRREAESDAKLMPLVRFLDGMTIKSAGQTITMTGKADIEAIQAFIMAFFELRAVPAG